MSVVSKVEKFGAAARIKQYVSASEEAGEWMGRCPLVAVQDERGV